MEVERSRDVVAMSDGDGRAAEPVARLDRRRIVSVSCMEKMVVLTG